MRGVGSQDHRMMPSASVMAPPSSPPPRGSLSRMKSYAGSGRLSPLLIKVLALYSAIVVGLVSTLVLVAGTPREQAIIKMALGLILLWVVLGGTLMLRLRDNFRALFQRAPLGWRPKFVIACTLLALLEEAVTTAMTNLAPLFGVAVGEAYITASANYLHVVLFHSVIVFIPGYIASAYLLSRYDFNPRQVFLLYGLWGSTAEAWLNPSSLFGGFWFFIYGLMIYLPAYSLPHDRATRRPRPRHFLLALLLPTVAAIPVVPVVALVRTWLGIPFFPGV